MSDELESAVAAFEAHADKADPLAMLTASQIVQQMAEAEITVGQIEQQLEVAQKKLNHLKTFRVPEAMAAANQIELKIADGQFSGIKCEIKDFVSGSLPKDAAKRAAAIQWLEHNGHGDLVRDTLVVPIPKAKNNDVHRLIDELQEQGYKPERTSDVHAMSLQAMARERLRKGKEVAADTLGLYLGRVAKLVWPSTRKGGGHNL